MEAKTALLFPCEIAFLNSFSLRLTKMVKVKHPWNSSLNKALHLALFLMSAVASSLISNFYFFIVFNKTCKTKCLILTVKFDEGQTEWTTYTLSPIIIPFHLSQIVSEFTIIKFIQLQFAMMVKETTKILFLRMTSPKVWKWVTSNESPSFQCKINVTSNLRSLHHSLFPPEVPTRPQGVSGQLPPGLSSNEHYCGDDNDDDYGSFFFPFNFVNLIALWLY